MGDAGRKSLNCEIGSRVGRRRIGTLGRRHACQAILVGPPRRGWRGGAGSASPEPGQEDARR